MRRLIQTTFAILCLCMLLSACSYPGIDALLPATPTHQPPSATPTNTVYVTSTLTPSITPTLPTPTFTETPTLIYNGPTPAPSDTPLATSTVGLLVTPPTDIPLADQPQASSLFTAILVSGNQLFWGSCEPNYLKVSVHVTDARKVHTVLLELSLKDVKTGEITDWGGGAIMDSDGKGTFTYTLTAQNFEHYRDYAKAWGRYQVVAFDSGMKRLGGSALYLNSIVIAPCP